jgi:hypothetical protein
MGAGVLAAVTRLLEAAAITKAFAGGDKANVDQLDFQQDAEKHCWPPMNTDERGFAVCKTLVINRCSSVFIGGLFCLGVFVARFPFARQNIVVAQNP